VGAAVAAVVVFLVAVKTPIPILILPPIRLRLIRAQDGEALTLQLYYMWTAKAL
jgi:hypothetical protein